MGLLSAAASWRRAASGPVLMMGVPEDPGMACCHLALPNTPCDFSGDRSNFTCPEGYYRQWWFCCEGTRQVGCGECTTNQETCWQGDFNCSISWYTGQSC